MNNESRGQITRYWYCPFSLTVRCEAGLTTRKSLIAVKSYWQVQNEDCSILEHAIKVVERKHQGEFSDTSGCSPNPLIRKWHQGLRGSPFKPANNRNLAWIINFGLWQAEWESDANLIPIRVLYNFVPPFFWLINN